MPHSITPIAAFAFGLAAAIAAPAQSTLLSRVEVLRDEAPDRVSAMVSSPDGLHVYAADSSTNKLVLLYRNESTGALTPVEALLNGINGAWSLGGVNGLAISPDGLHVYTAAHSDHSLGAYVRNTGDGSLEFVETYADDQGGIDGLSSAWAVAVSPDGSYVYAVGNSDNAVAAFARNASDGRLSFIEAEFDGVGGVDGIDAPLSVAVSPDSAHVYVAGSTDHAVAVFSVDSGDGTLDFVEAEFDGVSGVTGLFAAAAVAVSPDGADVYVAAASGTVAHFSRDPLDGALTFVNSQNDDPPASDGLDGARALAFSPDGAELYVTGETDGAVVAFSRSDVTGELIRIDDYIDGANALDGLAGAYVPFVTPDGKHVYVAGRVDEAVAVFERNDGDGSLTFVTDAFDGPPGHDGLDGAWGAALSPDGAHLYVAGYSDNTVTVFERDLAEGTLAPVQFVVEGENGIDGMDGPFAVAVAPDGAFVYVAARLNHAVLTFSRDALDGTLAFVETDADGVFGVDGIAGANALAISPDGAHLYATGSSDNAVAVFARDASLGTLGFVEAQFDGVSGVNGIANPQSVTVSPDGAHVYVTGNVDDAVAVFDRSVDTGSLTFVEAVVDGQNGVLGLDGAAEVAVSPDGAHVYATGTNQASFAGFARDGGTGALAFIESFASAGSGLVVTPDGGYVVILDFLGASAKAYRRDHASGALTFAGAATGVDGGARLVAAPDGAHYYGTSFSGSSVTVLAKGVAASVSGFVFDLTTGGGLTCAVVELTNAAETIVARAVTDRNGYYFVPDLPADLYNARILAPGYGETVSGTAIDLTAGAAVTRDFFAAAAAGAAGIRGQVTDAATGEPLVAVYIELIANGAVLDYTYTCASGRYEFPPIPSKGEDGAEVDLLFEAENYATEVQTVETIPNEVVTADQAMAKSVAGAATLAGVVAVEEPPAQAEPLEDAEVTIRGPVNTSTRTTNNGTYLFAALNDGTYTIHASAPGFGGQTGARTLSGGAVAAANFTLTPLAEPDAPLLSVTPLERAVGSGFAFFNVAVTNAGGGTMVWSANAVEGGDWIFVSPAGGLDAAEISVSCGVNMNAAPRTGRVRIALQAGGTAFADVVVTQGRRGDINGDGAANAVDIQLAVNGALGLDTQGVNADVDGDEAVDAVDVQFAINAALGL